MASTVSWTNALGSGPWNDGTQWQDGAGAGVLQVGGKGVGIVDGDVSGLAAVVLADNGTLTVKGGVSGVAGIAVGADASLGTGRLENAGGVSVGTGSSLSAAAIAGGGPITLAANARLVVAGDVGGTQSIGVGAGGAVTVNGTLSGLSGIALGTGGRLSLGGQDTNVPVALAGQNEIDLVPGGSIGGAVTGFDGTDFIKAASSRAVLGSGAVSGSVGRAFTLVTGG